MTQKKVGFPCSGLKAGSSFISQDKGMSESSVQSLEKALGPSLIWTGGLTSHDTSRGPQSSLLQKLPRPDSSLKLIGIPISLCKPRKGPLVSHLTSRGVCIILPNLV